MVILQIFTQMVYEVRVEWRNLAKGKKTPFIDDSSSFEIALKNVQYP